MPDFCREGKKGFKGCITYDCYGAGQRVTRDVFNGKSWKDDPGLTEPMGEALSVLRRIHEQLVLLDWAGNLPLSQDECSHLEKFRALLNPEQDWTQERLKNFPVDAVIKEIGTFLRGLRHHLD